MGERLDGQGAHTHVNEGQDRTWTGARCGRLVKSWECCFRFVLFCFVGAAVLPPWGSVLAVPLLAAACASETGVAAAAADAAAGAARCHRCHRCHQQSSLHPPAPPILPCCHPLCRLPLTPWPLARLTAPQADHSSMAASPVGSKGAGLAARCAAAVGTGAAAGCPCCSWLWRSCSFSRCSCSWSRRICS